MLHSTCQQIWKTQKWPQNWKRLVFIPVPKNGNAKECSDYCTIDYLYVSDSAGNYTYYDDTAYLSHYIKADLSAGSFSVCNHVFEQGVITKDPTCTDTGVMTYLCSSCGFSRDEIVPMEEHPYIETTITNATCSAPGEVLQRCPACGDKKVSTVNPLGHSYGKWIPVGDGTENVVSTCTRCGKKKYKSTTLPSCLQFSMNIGDVEQADVICKGLDGIVFGSESNISINSDDESIAGIEFYGSGHEDEGTCLSFNIYAKKPGEAHLTIYDTQTHSIYGLITVKVADPIECNWEMCIGKEYRLLIPYVSSAYSDEPSLAFDKPVNYEVTNSREIHSAGSIDVGIDLGPRRKHIREITLKVNESGNYVITAYDPDSVKVATYNINVQSHDYILVQKTEATCQKKSVETYECSRCLDTYSKDAGDLAPHTWNSEYTTDCEATCIENGTESIHCSICGAIDESTITSIPALGHEWDAGVITTEPTCTEDGIKTFTCNRCKDTRTEPIEAYGHTWDEEFTVDTEPTCTEEGSKSKHCANCDERSDVTAIPANGHTFGDWEEITPSTCENSGVQQHICDICGFTETESLDPTGHTWEDELTVDVEPTCTADGSKSRHCVNCDAVTDSEVIPATGHSYGDWEITKEASCTDTGEKEKTCSVCDDVVTEEIPALGHAWNEEPTVDKAATCKEDGSQSFHCARCDETKDPEVIPATGDHTWDAGKITKATTSAAGKKVFTCTVCGETKTEVIPKVTAPTSKVTILNTVANSAKKTNDVIWDKSKVKGATGYIIEWRARGASKWASTRVGNVTRGVTSGLTIGNLYEIRVTPYKAATATTAEVKGTPSDIVYRYFFTTQKIRLASNSKGTFTMSWAKDPKATSYQVLYTTNSNGAGAAQNIKTAGASATSITVKDIKVNGKVQKLKSGTTYYVQVREVRTVGGKNYIGNISCPVAVKVK